MSEDETRSSRRSGKPAATEPPRGRWQRLRRWRTDHSLELRVAGLIFLLILVYLLPSMFYSVYPGQAAVVWYRFGGGTDVEYVRSEGLRFKLPWDLAYVYDIRLQEQGRSFDALTADGLPVQVEISVRFRPHQEGLGALHKHVGPDYFNVVLFPEIAAHARELIGKYRPAELYSERREEIQRQILEAMTTGSLLQFRVGGHLERVVHVEDVLIRGIDLPAKVKDAIHDKLAQEQRMLEFDYRILKEAKERVRKRIEAQGIRDFQDIVGAGISERYLKWKGIDATLELSRSPNAKIVVIGAGEDGLPIILGGLDALPPGGVSPDAVGASPAPPPATSPQGTGAPVGTAPVGDAPP